MEGTPLQIFSQEDRLKEMKLVLPFAIVFSNRLEYAFADRTIDEIVYSESRAAMHKIDDTFEPDTAIAVIVPGREYEKEKALLFEAEKLDGIKTASGLFSHLH